MRCASNSSPNDHGYGKRSSLSSANVGQLKLRALSIVRYCAEILNGVGSSKPLIPAWMYGFLDIFL
jgi:hypothetical protein